MYAEVAIPVHITRTFTYVLPDRWRNSIQPGMRVVVPFGGKLLTGYVVGISDRLDAKLTDVSLKEIRQVLDTQPLLTAEMLALTRWVADYYCASWGEVIRGALPAGSSATTEWLVSITERGREALQEAGAANSRASTRIITLSHIAGTGWMKLSELEKWLGKSKARAIVKNLQTAGYVELREEIAALGTQPKFQSVVRLAGSDQQNGSATDHAARRKLTPGQEALLSFLRARGGEWPRAELVELTGASPSSLRTLEKRGLIEVAMRVVERRPLDHVRVIPAIEFDLTQEQRRALEPIVQQIDADNYGAFLLHGITGSGKTEVYIRAMRYALDRGKSSLMLVPEISLTPVFSQRLAAHFGDGVATLHSSLSEGERFDEWHRIKRGAAQVVIGARSAIFAPLDRLGLLVVDEEQESSYKQEESPRYNARDTGIYRALQLGAVAALGSATPSLESFHNVHTGKYRYLQLGERIGGRKLAEVSVVDMRPLTQRRGQVEIFSDELLRALVETHERGEQSILLLNRRGFAPAVLCRRCGLVLRCPNCDVALTYHRVVEQLLCHYCNYRASLPEVCPRCKGEFIHLAGVGTEQVEERLRHTFPEMTIARMDRDAMRRRGSYERTLSKFASGEIQTLVGTQMVAKGHDFPNVTLVGVVSADSGLALPDFRAAERTFQLLTQVAGRAGRGELPGRVVIQSYYPEHYAIRFAQAQDFEGFYQYEIQLRRVRQFPPFTTMIAALIAHKDPQKARSTAGELVRALRAQRIESDELRLLGPAPAPLERLRGQYRFQVLIKCARRAPAREALLVAIEQMRQKRLDVHSIRIDVDPLDLM